MPTTTAMFFDVGGVVLTNGWDRSARQRAAQIFGFDWDEFETRHELVVADFETGRIGLKEYLDVTLFYEQRPFARDQFRQFLFAQSQPCPDTLAILEKLAQTKLCLLAALNNESLDLNRYRIEQFHLTNHFQVFFSSCYLGLRKPDPRIYQLALQITQRQQDECLFIDDRSINIEAAARLGMRTLRYQNPQQLEERLRAERVL
jgi:putative hydrolase of the HAD superfamily